MKNFYLVHTVLPPLVIVKESFTFPLNIIAVTFSLYLLWTTLDFFQVYHMRNLVGIHSDLLQHSPTCGAEDNVDVRNNQVGQKIQLN